jgi:hypothetical protein
VAVPSNRRSVTPLSVTRTERALDEMLGARVFLLPLTWREHSHISVKRWGPIGRRSKKSGQPLNTGPALGRHCPSPIGWTCVVKSSPKRHSLVLGIAMSIFVITKVCLICIL